MIAQIKNEKITTKQKKKFFRFVLDIYTGKIKKSHNWVELINYGFCNIYRYFFSEDAGDFELLPELRRHKPRKHFYSYKNTKTDDKDQFWFPVGDNKKRIKLCEKILENL